MIIKENIYIILVSVLVLIIFNKEGESKMSKRLVLTEKELVNVNEFVGEEKWYRYPWHSDYGMFVFPGKVVKKMIQERSNKEIQNSIIQEYKINNIEIDLVEYKGYAIPDVVAINLYNKIFSLSDDTNFELVEAAIVGILVQKEIEVVNVNYSSSLHTIMNKYIQD